ncbi:hypothetical protein ACFLT7_07495 [candidate division KSB1 bacterium]
MNKAILILAISSLLIHSGCDKEPFFNLEWAPESCRIDGRKYYLKTDLDRDFSYKASPPEGSPLYIAAIIIGSDSTEIFPKTIDADGLWIFNGREIWTAQISEKLRSDHPTFWNRFVLLARDGPLWGPDINVDVVVRIINKSDNNRYYLKALQQPINESS